MGLSHEDKSQFDKSFSRPWLTVVNYIFEHLVQLSVSRHLNSIMWKVVLTACYSLIQIPSRMRAKDMLGLDIHGQLICPCGLQVIVRDSRASCLLAPYLKFIDSDPTIWRKSLEHWDKELEAAGPVADQEHHTDQVEDPHEHRGHVQELQEQPVNSVWKLTLSWLRATQLFLGKPSIMGMRKCKQPDQWPSSSIKNIRLTSCVNNPIDFNNWKRKN